MDSSGVRLSVGLSGLDMSATARIYRAWIRKRLDSILDSEDMAALIFDNVRLSLVGMVVEALRTIRLALVFVPGLPKGYRRKSSSMIHSQLNVSSPHSLAFRTNTLHMC
jgi:hypothetical protein